MTIPTRDELIERAELALNGDPSFWRIADLLDSEIRRAVADELEALRDLPANSRSAHIGARLAALRQTEQPPGNSSQSAPRPDAHPKFDGASARAVVGDGEVQASTPAPGATFEGDTMNFGGSPTALSDADVLERAAEILRKSDIKVAQDAATVCEFRAGGLRAASAPKPVDVFEGFVREWFDEEYEHGGPEERTAIGCARSWFSPLVEALEWIEKCSTPEIMRETARCARAALRQRAQEASR